MMKKINKNYQLRLYITFIPVKKIFFLLFILKFFNKNYIFFP